MISSPATLPSGRSATQFPVGSFNPARHPQQRFFPRPLQQFARVLQGLIPRVLGTSSPRRLQVAETLTLGDKRSLYIVRVDGTEYLLGAGEASLTLLTQLGELESRPSFHDTLQQAHDEGSAS